MESAHIGTALRRCRASHPESAPVYVPFLVSCHRFFLFIFYMMNPPETGAGVLGRTVNNYILTFDIEPFLNYPGLS